MRARAERVLRAGEDLPALAEVAVHASVHQRLQQDEFVARGWTRLASARESGDYVSADDCLRGLRSKLDRARSGPQSAR